ncbi:MAG: hypothetical protein KF834_02140 [Burkholderiales bacterium]|nr:hypothetical protein [Burkholderiales bacterium]
MKTIPITLTMPGNLCVAIVALLLLATSQAIAAEATACNLLDKATASEIFGRAAARGPTPFKSQNQGRALSSCDFAVDQPLMVLSLRVTEHESPASAKAVVTKAASSKLQGVSTSTEWFLGDSAVWTASDHMAAYVVSKGAYVLMLAVRGTSAGSDRFVVKPEIRRPMKQAISKALGKL